MTTKVSAAMLQAPGRKNAIINGGMDVWQRGTSQASIANGAFLPDRWKYNLSGTTAVHAASRSTDVPSVALAGRLFNYSYLLDCTTADGTLAASDFISLEHKIEGYNWLPLAQRDCVLSFYVKATKTGVYCVNFRNTGNDQVYVAEYTVSASDTWEKKTISLPASPSAGTWDYTNGEGLKVSFVLASGTDWQTTAGVWGTANKFCTANQVNAVDDVANNFRITGVQLELGDSASEFEHRHFQDELALCHRYYYQINAAQSQRVAMGQAHQATEARVLVPFPTIMRGTPSASTPSAAAWDLTAANAARLAVSGISVSQASMDSCELNVQCASGLTAGHATFLADDAGAAASIAFSAEL